MGMLAPDVPSGSVFQAPPTKRWLTLPDQYEMRRVVVVVGSFLATVHLPCSNTQRPVLTSAAHLTWLFWAWSKHLSPEGGFFASMHRPLEPWGGGTDGDRSFRPLLGESASASDWRGAGKGTHVHFLTATRGRHFSGSAPAKVHCDGSGTPGLGRVVCGGAFAGLFDWRHLPSIQAQPKLETALHTYAVSTRAQWPDVAASFLMPGADPLPFAGWAGFAWGGLFLSPLSLGVGLVGFFPRLLGSSPSSPSFGGLNVVGGGTSGCAARLARSSCVSRCTTGAHSSSSGSFCAAPRARSSARRKRARIDLKKREKREKRKNSPPFNRRTKRQVTSGGQVVKKLVKN